ncbi:type VI secretion system protein TssL, short form [Escherichia coli]
MKKETDINIDALLRDTFLTVVELRQGTTVRHGMELYRHCQRQVELVRERLKDAGFSRESVEHITYAQCALLDETVLSRSGMDDGQAIWMKDPLQSHFFNTLQAGELLYERMKQVLQEPAPAQAVLTCFHRVLLLGFRGRYQDPVAPERDQLISTLNGLVAPFGVLPETAVLNVPLPSPSLRGLLRATLATVRAAYSPKPFANARTAWCCSTKWKRRIAT